jgi:multisubunit Na+/H+ antiporter MnhC subunit
MNDEAWLFSAFGTGTLLVLIAGVYCVLVSRNLIRTIIGVEILTKAVTLLLILAGYLTGRTALAQSLAITLIIIEVAVVAVAVSIVIGLYKHDDDVDARALKKLKG